jgi:hypothetical protein
MCASDFQVIDNLLLKRGLEETVFAGQVGKRPYLGRFVAGSDTLLGHKAQQLIYFSNQPWGVYESTRPTNITMRT